MFFFVIFICIAGIIGGAVAVGLLTPKRSAPQHKLSRREKLDLAKVAGVLPARKEN
ncbi:MAG TPA: hypothetical protein VG841_13010 [Caulobacterales bacterium]|nr:hypothetical protein [Caulobacterales bacterium]